MVNQFCAEQQFLEPLEDPSVVAMLVSLGFPLCASGHEVRLCDVGGGGRRGREQRAWTVGRVSPRCGDAKQVMAAWQQPLPGLTDGRQVLNGAQVCKLALHNRRCLLLQVQQGARLFAGSAGGFGRLGNWGFDGGYEVVDVAGAAGDGFVVWDSLGVAVAATCGLQVAEHVVDGGRHGWRVLPGPEGCRWSPEFVLGAARDVGYVEGHEDVLALAAAVLLNRAALVAAGREAGAVNVLHRNGRYAVISAAADGGTQLAAARHLCV